MQLLKKIFNSDKKYYLELNEAQDSQPVQEAVETANKVTDAAQEKLQSAKTTGTKPAKQEVTTTAKAQKNGKKAQPKPATSSINSGTSSYEQPFWVAAMYNNKNSSSNKSNGSRAEQTFATDNLMPTITNSRRRPGPSLNKFKEMASKAKTPRG